jgi:hypothetical protein
MLSNLFQCEIFIALDDLITFLCTYLRSCESKTLGSKFDRQQSSRKCHRLKNEGVLDFVLSTCFSYCYEP